jgi:hypothetical protein
MKYISLTKKNQLGVKDEKRFSKKWIPKTGMNSFI